jgi:hypothetical protein
MPVAGAAVLKLVVRISPLPKNVASTTPTPLANALNVPHDALALLQPAHMLPRRELHGGALPDRKDDQPSTQAIHLPSCIR